MEVTRNEKEGHHAAVVALYSQRLARPPPRHDAPTLKPTKPGSSRRRPRSAAAVLSSPTILAAPRGSSIAKTTHSTEHTPPRVARPASATVHGTHSGERSARRRPVTATAIANTPVVERHGRKRLPLPSSSQRHRHRQVVGAGYAPPQLSSGGSTNYGAVDSTAVYSGWRQKQRQRCLSTHGPGWECGHDEDIGAEYPGNSAGRLFWHVYANVDPDPRVMEEATTFVTKILGAKEQGSKQAQLHEERPPTRSPLKPTSRRCGVKGQIMHVTATRSPFLPDGARSSRGTCRRRAQSNKSPSPSGVKDTNILEGFKLNRADRESGHGTSNSTLYSFGEFPFPCPSDVGGDNDTTRKENCCEMGVSPASSREVAAPGGKTSTVAEATRIGNESVRLNKEHDGHHPHLTPAELDAFCSMRPTLERQHHTSTPNAFARKRCLLRKRQRRSGEDCHDHLSRSRPPPQPPPPRSLADGSKVVAWTSVFGAVCGEGASRSRARAVVLEAARRRARKQTRVTSCLSATQRRLNVAESSMEQVTAPEMRTEIVELTPQSLTDGTAQFDVTTLAAKDEDADLVVAQQPAGEATATSTESGNEVWETIGSDYRSHPVADVGGTINHAAADADIANLVTEKTDRSLNEDMGNRVVSSRPSPGMSTGGLSMTLSPLFRLPRGEGVTYFGVNTPHCLQVSHGCRSFSCGGSGISNYLREARDRSLWGRPNGVRRPWTAGERDRNETLSIDICKDYNRVKPLVEGTHQIASVCVFGSGGELLHSMIRRTKSDSWSPVRGSRLLALNNAGAAFLGSTDGASLLYRVNKVAGIIASIFPSPKTPVNTGISTVEKTSGVPLVSPRRMPAARHDAGMLSSNIWGQRHDHICDVVSRVFDKQHPRQTVEGTDSVCCDGRSGKTKTSDLEVGHPSAHEPKISSAPPPEITEPRCQKAGCHTTTEGTCGDCDQAANNSCILHTTQTDGAEGATIRTDPYLSKDEETPNVSPPQLRVDQFFIRLASSPADLRSHMEIPTTTTLLAPPCEHPESLRSASSAPGLLQESACGIVRHQPNQLQEAKSTLQSSPRNRTETLVSGKTDEAREEKASRCMVIESCRTAKLNEVTASLGGATLAESNATHEEGDSEVFKAAEGGPWSAIEAEDVAQHRLVGVKNPVLGVILHAARTDGVHADHAQSAKPAVSWGADTDLTTSKEFRRAAVQLKAMAADTSVAADGHEEMWRLSKEKAEELFNDRRLAAQEDARDSAEGAASETRGRLHRIVTQYGLEEHERKEKEAALEELRRVLAQDTAMYAARASASERMVTQLQALEAGNNAADLSLLMECRRGRSLRVQHDRTERGRDKDREACRRRRAEANAMEARLDEARHARGLLLGHVRHIVERMTCLAEHVLVMERWCQGRLGERRNARRTSDKLKLDFNRRSNDLDELLKKTPFHSKKRKFRSSPAKAVETTAIDGGAYDVFVAASNRLKEMLTCVREQVKATPWSRP